MGRKLSLPKKNRAIFNKEDKPGIQVEQGGFTSWTTLKKLRCRIIIIAKSYPPIPMLTHKIVGLYDGYGSM